MTENEARREATRLGREHAGRSWVARESEPGSWAAVELTMPGGPRPKGPLAKTEGEQLEPLPGRDPRVDWDRHTAPKPGFS